MRNQTLRSQANKEGKEEGSAGCDWAGRLADYTSRLALSLSV